MLEYPDEDEVMIGEVQVNEDVENVPGQRFQQQSLTIGKRKNMKESSERSNDKKRFHELPWSSKFRGCKQRGHQKHVGY